MQSEICQIVKSVSSCHRMSAYGSSFGEPGPSTYAVSPPASEAVKKRIAISCDFCRKRKIRCSGRPQPCQACVRASVECVFREKARRPRKKAGNDSAQRNSPETYSQLSLPVQTAGGRELNAEESDSSGYDSDTLTMAGLNVTKEVYLGQTAIRHFVAEQTPQMKPQKTNSARSETSSAAGSDQIKIALPNRADCDALVNDYFEYMHCALPFLDQNQIINSFDSIYASGGTGNALSCCIALYILALGCHRSPRSQRMTESKAFGDAAARIMTPRLIGPCTLRLCQAVILYSLYIHTTKEQIDAWSTLGLAVRIGHGLGLDKDVVAAPDRDLRLRLWLSLFCLDTQMAVSLGRPRCNIPIEDVRAKLAAAQTLQDRYPCLEAVVDLYMITMDMSTLIYDHRPGTEGSSIRPARMLAGMLEMNERWELWEQALPPVMRYPVNGQATHEATIVRTMSVFYKLLYYLPAADLLRSWTTSTNDPSPPQSMLSKGAIESAQLCVKACKDVVSSIWDSQNSTPPRGWHFHNSFVLYHVALVLIGLKWATPDSWAAYFGLFGDSECETLSTTMYLLDSLRSKSPAIDVSYRVLNGLFIETFTPTAAPSAPMDLQRQPAWEVPTYPVPLSTFAQPPVEPESLYAYQTPINFDSFINYDGSAVLDPSATAQNFVFAGFQWDPRAPQTQFIPMQSQPLPPYVDNSWATVIF